VYTYTPTHTNKYTNTHTHLHAHRPTFGLDKFICLPSHSNTNLEIRMPVKNKCRTSSSQWTYVPHVAGLISAA